MGLPEESGLRGRRKAQVFFFLKEANKQIAENLCHQEWKRKAEVMRTT